MIVVYPFPAPDRRRLDELVVAYVCERGPSRGPDALRTQIRAVRRRAGRDGVAIGLLVVESGGLPVSEGRGQRLDTVIAVAGNDDLPRVLYVADVDVLANSPHGVLAAMRALSEAGFELRAPSGRIAPTGRRARSLAAYASRPPDVPADRNPAPRPAPDRDVGTSPETVPPPKRPGAWGSPVPADRPALEGRRSRAEARS